MTVLIWIGVALAALGLIGLVACIRRAMWLRGAELEDDRAKVEMQRLIFWHMAAIGAAFLGMGLVMTGVLLAP